MRAVRIVFLFFVSLNAVAQTPGFRFGPRIGFGMSDFSKLPGERNKNVFALQIGLMACKQLNENFAVEVCPQVATYGSRSDGIEQNGVTKSMAPALYSFHDDFRVGVVEFPFFAKYSVPINKIYVNAFAGPEICMNMFGAHSRTYDDKQYNFDHGFSGYSIKDLNDRCYAAVLGFGAEKEIGKGFLGLDMRLQYPLSPSGKIEMSRFYVQAGTLGITWTH